MTSVLRCVERDHNLVTLARTDLVVAARTPVRLVGLVRLHVANIDPRFVPCAVVGPVIAGHRVCSAARVHPVTRTDAARDRRAIPTATQGRT